MAKCRGASPLFSIRIHEIWYEVSGSKAQAAALLGTSAEETPGARLQRSAQSPQARVGCQRERVRQHAAARAPAICRVPVACVAGTHPRRFQHACTQTRQALSPVCQRTAQRAAYRSSRRGSLTLSVQ